MKTYKQFTEAAALAIPAAMKMAPYVIPAAGAAANIFKGMMQSDASDKFKARQRGGRISPGEAQRRQAREDRKAEARRRARENASNDKPTVENVPTAKKEKKEKVDPRLERAAGQILDRLRNEEVQSEGMLPVPSDKRKRIINPMVAAMPPKTEKGINDAMKKGLDKLDKKMDRMYKDLNSVPKDREKA
jgi:hypothetical protein